MRRRIDQIGKWMAMAQTPSTQRRKEIERELLCDLRKRAMSHGQIILEWKVLSKGPDVFNPYATIGARATVVYVGRRRCKSTHRIKHMRQSWQGGASFAKLNVTA